MGLHHQRGGQPEQVCLLGSRAAEVWVPFIPPMLAARLEDPRSLADSRFIAEPKLDGQRARSSTCASIAPCTPSAALAGS